MTPQQKQIASDIQKNVHQWMTIIGFPVLLILVGDMYADFKRVRENDIRQDEKIQNQVEQLNETKTQLQSLGNYVYRGIK